ncbi:hypothetical protein LA303_07865 [Candidatus Sulfidibacterium hydrothermale]|uniref:hypothetical protein n=1 Tax=Candidatus Sulfidibacterium hydrothermale TaxID=2875962 RepID=UPI001F0A4936|nr:hypothetical protein [Candidatus Sulfidibacterium hydrothermale]UBM61339.1 hypothetical protein LA303_07865 [Candidatus Sulfidibacterium hydrothermale]
MSYLKNIIYIGTILFLFGCQNKQENIDVKIINQIFPQLTKEMHLSIIKPIDFPPPLPKTLSPDLLDEKNIYVKRSEIEKYIASLYKYRSYLQNYCENYNRLDSLNVVVGLSDTLYAYTDIEKELAGKNISKEYLGVLTNLANPHITNEEIELKNITNTGIFKLEKVSELGWHPKIEKNFWKKKRDYYLSGILLLSRIYLDKTKTHGLFYCTKSSNEKEPLSKIIFVKKINGNWKIDNVKLK